MENIQEILIKFNKEEFDNAIDKAFENKKKDIELDGFRKGKVPKDIYYKRRGKEALYMDAVDILAPMAYDRLYEENKDLKPIIAPKIDLRALSDNEVVFAFTITTMPEVNIEKYTGLDVKQEEVKVTDEEISNGIYHLQRQYAELVSKDGEVDLENVVIIDFEGFIDGTPFEGGKAENYELTIGSNTFIPGFEAQLLEMKKDEEKEINVTFPEDYHVKDLRGKDAVFKVKVNEIKERVLRELDEDFFEDLAIEGVNSKETLEKEIEENIRVNKERDAENKYFEELLEKIRENTTVEIPEELLERQTEKLFEDFENRIKMQGATLELLYEVTETSKEQLEEELRQEAKVRILNSFILEEIVKKENLKATDEEIDAEYEKLQEQYNMTREELEKEIEDKEMFILEIETKKALNFLKENN